MFKLFCVFLTIIYSPLCRGRDDDVQFIADANHEFDLLIFTQVWPVTGCISWMERSKSHTCTLPSPKEIWTIHGVWPTRFGTIGPAFCNSSAEFDINTLRPFEEQLKQFWINIQNGTPLEALWKHEWLKHGTCAAQLDELNNENKYFGQGLSWLQQYSMSSILQKGGIVPDQSHTLISIHKAVVGVLNKNPSIHCIYDRERDEIFLDEIRICFDKTLTLVDCDGVVDDSEVLIDYPGGKVITNCDLSKPILYPSVVPPSHRPELRKTEWKFPFWPVTRCIFLAEKNKEHICGAEMFDEQRWTIHGIWPTRVGTKSPAFCNKSKAFDVHRMEPFVDELSEHWVDVGNDTAPTLFWHHEWSKHGTCCAETELANVDKFFGQGLTWLRLFHMTHILETAGISPGGEYRVVDVHNAVYKTVKKVPSIHCGCTNDGGNYLSEIRLCFSKALELIDCHVTGNAEMVYKSIATNVDVVTNCNLHRDVIYPKTFPASDFRSRSNRSWLQTKLQKAVDFLKEALV